MYEIFKTFIEQPVFNLLEFIYAIIPGHDLGVAIILFTIVIRLLLWPLVKRQLHQTKAMRKLQPELKKIKKAAKGDRQKEARLQMELYKEHGVKPFATIGTLIIQLPILIALYQSVRKLIADPNILFTFSYDWVNNLPWIQSLSKDISQFEHTLFGVIDLAQRGLGPSGIYVPAVLLAVAAAIMQFYQSKQMLPDDKDQKKLGDILKSASTGQQADQGEVAAAVSRGMIYFLPFITFMFAVSVPAALSLYIFTSSAIGYIQQARVLRDDEEEMHEIATEEKNSKQNTDSKVQPKQKQSKKPSKKSAKKKRRR